MQNQVVVITGASHGIGKATALELARAGAKQILASRNHEQLEQVTSEIAALGGEAYGVVCDVTDTAAVQNLFQQCRTRFGRIDVLFNNAGIGQFISARLTTDEVWDEAINVNLKGSFLCIREAIPLLEESGGGLVINNASVAAVRGFPNFAAYCASKAGVLGLTRALREELRDRKIRVAAILPGATDTPFWDHVAGDWNRSLMIKAEDVAKVVVTMMSSPPNMLIEEVSIMPAGGAL